MEYEEDMKPVRTYNVKFINDSQLYTYYVGTVRDLLDFIWTERGDDHDVIENIHLVRL